MGTGIAQSVEALYFITELHTSSVWARVQPGDKIFICAKQSSSKAAACKARL